LSGKTLCWRPSTYELPCLFGNAGFPVVEARAITASTKLRGSGITLPGCPARNLRPTPILFSHTGRNPAVVSASHASPLSGNVKDSLAA